MNDDGVLRIDGSQPGDSLRMMKTPDAWPHGGFLPLTRGPELGVLVNRPGVPRATVFKVNILDRRLGFLLVDPARAAAELDIPREDYETLEEVDADGWRTD